jgi:hypothetical protein
MLTRLRTRWFAGAGALLLILAMSGAALGADNAGGTAGDGTTAQVIVPDQTDCDTGTGGDEAEDGETGASEPGDADEATETDETDGDEAEQGDETDETDGDEAEQGDETDETDGDEAEQGDETDETDGDEAEQGDENDEGDDACADDESSSPEADNETDTETDAEEAAKADVPCVEVPAPPFDPVIFTGPGAFGAYVSSVANSEAVGGKNCNHGGAVSAAVHAAKAAAKAARDAAKAEREVARDAAKAAREAAREAAKAERAATHTNHGKGKGGGN